AVPREIERDDPEPACHFRIVENVAELAAVGTSGVKAQQGHTAACLRRTEGGPGPVITTRLAHMPEALTPHDQPMLTAPFGPCNAAHRHGFCDLKSAIKLGFGKIPQQSIGPERDRFAMRKLRARSETLIAGPLHGVRIRSLHDHIPIS